MSLRNKIKKNRSALSNRHKEQVQNKDSRGRWPTILLKDQIPAGVELFKSTEERHTADIIPWEAGPDMPYGERGVPITEEGEVDYVLDIWVHQNVGATKEPFVCPYENFGQACPICEYIKSRRLPLETWKDLKPKRRVLYLLWVHTTREQERKGIQLWETSHFSMEEKIAEIAKLPKGGGAVVFSDPDNGKSVSWTRKGAGRTNTQYLGHSFTDREAPIPDKILDQTFPIDQVVKMKPTYEEIHRAFKSQMDRLEKSSSVEEDDEAGSNFSESSMGDVPDWDSTDIPDDAEEPAKEKKSGVKRTVRKRKRVRK